MGTAWHRAIELDAQGEADVAPGRPAVLVMLAGITVLAAVLRLPFVGHQSLWLDEIYTREIVREASLAGVWRHVEATESTPPLYYVLGWVTHARGTVAMRLIPAIALTAAVPVGYLAFRRFIGTWAALATAAMLAVNPMLVWYSTDARSYGLLVLTALLSVWGCSALLEERSKRRFTLWVAASAACVWTHYFGVFVVGAEVVVLLLAGPRARRATLAWSALLGVLLVPLVPLVASQSGDERAAFIEQASLSRRVTEAIRQFAMGPNVPRAWLEAAGLLVACVGLLAGVWIAWHARHSSRVQLLSLLAISLAAPLLLALVRIDDRFYARNVIAAVPLAAALAAPAMLRMRAAPLAAYLLLATATSVWVASDWRYQQVDWKGALARAEATDPSAPVFAVTDQSAPVVQAYLARSPARAAVVAERVWVLVEPVRAAGQRALGPAPLPSLSGFTVIRSLEVHGFELALEHAAQPTLVTPVEVDGATLFSAPSGKRVPVSSSETSHRRRAVSVSRAALERPTSFGLPRISSSPSGPAKLSPGTSATAAYSVGSAPPCSSWAISRLPTMLSRSSTRRPLWNCRLVAA
jgi:4-amino-4-deoxy-L-arabinose transferase-like glycosyltransferase